MANSANKKEKIKETGRNPRIQHANGPRPISPFEHFCLIIFKI
jgi:hypothetical protein